MSSYVPLLGGADVHIWRCWLDQPAATVAQLRPLLSEDEHARAARFAFEQLKTDYIVARGTLRTILGAYARMDPAEIRFTYSPYGKPALEEPGAIQPLQFNLSHAHRLMAVGIARHRQVGVDVEYVRPDMDYEELAPRVFSVREQDALRSVPLEKRLQAFFHGWTRKEAFIKAIGQGLSHPLAQFDITLRPDEPAELQTTRPDPQEAGRWRLDSLAMPAEYVGAVVAAGRDWRLTQGWWPSPQA